MTDESDSLNPGQDPAGVEQHQALRLKRFYLAGATYGMMMIAALIADRLGLGHMTTYEWFWFVATALLINVFFWFLFKTGLNCAFADASLTAEQIFGAAVFGLIPLYSLPQARPIVLMFFLIPFNFGMLRLRRNQFLRIVVLVLLLYASLLVVESAEGRAGFDLGYELFLFLLLGVLLVWTAFFGGMVTSLREGLKAKNRALELANERIARISATDELTRLYNRRHAFEVLKQIHADAVAGQSIYTLAILDIDHFKAVNDNCGHQVGDLVLSGFAEMLADGLRSNDMVLAQPPDEDDSNIDSAGFLARYGGEEFILVFSNTTQAQSATCLNRIRERVKAYAFAGDRNIHISFSGGVASYHKGDMLEDVIGRADRAMYCAKSQGRDQIAMEGSRQMQHAEA